MKARIVKMSLVLAMAVLLVGMAGYQALAQEGKVTQEGDNTGFVPSNKASQGLSASDFKNAKPMPMPTYNGPPVQPSETAPAVEYPGSPGFEPGNTGNGKMNPVVMPEESSQAESLGEDDEFSSQEYGTSNHVFTTSRVDLSSNNPSKYYPYRAAGKLYFKDGSTSYVCSASLVKKGVLVTAAHCVADFGKKKFYSNWTYVPAKYSSSAPYGTWYAQTAWVKTSYYDGTDSCYQSGVVCQNDVAVIVLKTQSSKYPGTTTGWLGYGYNGYGFNGNNQALINQLGYPVSHDGGLMMQRTDSQGFVSSTMSSNTIWGSRQTGGSSGGPELVNLGKAATLSGTSYGSEAQYNTVVGVTSWGYTNTAVKQQGASSFTSNNIVSLLSSACTAYPSACK